MKKSILFLSFVVALWCCPFQSTLWAQVPMAIPNGSFEQWTSHSGYSVTVLIFPISVYSAYSTPSAWNYPAYPVNESVSLMGMNVNINTTVPLVKASQVTDAVPDSNTAVKLESFMLSDIVSSTVLSVAGSYIDSSLTEQVIPSILLTGEINVDAFIPLLSDIMSGTGDIYTMIPVLLAEDVNDYITGGIPLEGLRPGMLTGSYKYHSAVGGDNGGVVMIGTRYNTVTHKRDVVGAGFNIGLYDTSAYTPFEVEYFPLSDLVPGSPYFEPDSLIIALVSSASTNMQQGSYLCLDNLVLWSAPCAEIATLTTEPQIHEVLIDWSVSDLADSFEIEYGPAGFTLGDGTTAITTGTSLTVSGLAASTAYDAYVRSLCSDTVYGEWSATQFTTLDDTCATVLLLALESSASDASMETVLTWRGSSQPDHWEVEYGFRGFEHGTGTVVETTDLGFEIYPLEQSQILSPNSWYDFYVRSVCSDDIYGEWDSIHYLSHCAKVGSLAVNSDNASVTAGHLVSGYSISWVDTTDTRRWGVYYGVYDSLSPDNWGTYVEVNTPSFEFPPLLPDMNYTVEVAALCAENNYGEIVSASFTTLELASIERADAITLTVSPNPAHGQCEVSISDSQPAQLRLYSLDGRLLQTLTSDGEPVTLQLPSTGVYLLHATTPAGTTTYKIINN